SIFKQLRKRAPCLLFIDEIDSVGKRRSDGSSSVENDSANTLNELLTQLDGLGSSAGIVIIGATNRIDVLDPALVRAGRFDLHITVPAPDQMARERILLVSARDVEIAPDVDFATVARGTPGFSGADLATLVNE
ncbi:AAA family ATPase, partial [Lysobacter sp. TAB13]|uniref:AAA family ATPase n=1 Tax=Lysobacter sp. TAB13 TaxID=3233065 RepID=UPI003F9B54AE